MKKSIIKKLDKINSKKSLTVLLFGMMTFALVACGETEQEIANWNSVAGESLTVNVTEAEIEEAVNQLNNVEEAIVNKNESMSSDVSEQVKSSSEEAVETVMTEENVNAVENVTEDDEIVEKAVEGNPLENLSFEASISDNDDESIHATFRIIDGNGNTLQIIENDPFFTKDWFLGFRDSSCYFEDYNFDGYLDVITIGSSGYVNAYNFVYLWDVNEEQFVFSKEGSDIANAVVHAEKEQIISVQRDAGLPIYRLYEMKDGKITLVAEIMEVHAEDASVVCTETILETGAETIVTSLDQLNEIWDGYNIELYN